MTFEEVGETVEYDQEILSRPEWKPMGEQTPVEMLSRPRLLQKCAWSTSGAREAIVSEIDVYSAIYLDPYFNRILSQYYLWRADLEVTIRLNTSQFYYGALSCTLAPRAAGATGLCRQASLGATYVSASTADAIILTIPYCHNDPFFRGFPPDVFDTRLTIRVMHPLGTTAPSAPDTIDVLVYAKLVNPHIVWNKPEAQSTSVETKPQPQKSKNPDVPIRPAKHNAGHTPTSKESKTVASNSSFERKYPTLSSIPVLGTIVGTAYDLFGVAKETGLLTLAALLDKPTLARAAERVYSSPITTHRVSDVPDSATQLGLYSNSYLASGPGRMIISDKTALSALATLPGLVAVATLTTNDDLWALEDIGYGRTFFGAMASCHTFWRGGVKLLFSFYCSTFVSARYAITFVPSGTAPSSDYQNGVTHIVDVKGDTTLKLTMPYVSDSYWQKTGASMVLPFRIYIRRLTVHVGPDSSADDDIYLSIFVSAAEDIQFSLPREAPLGPLNDTVRVLAPIESQSAIRSEFEEIFPPVIAGAEFSFDAGYCVSDTTRYTTDILKMYAPANANGIPTSVQSRLLNCYTFWCGGRRVRGRPPADADFMDVTIVPGNTITRLHTDAYGLIEVNLPYYSQLPYSYTSAGLEPLGTWEFDVVHAFSDDIQLGFPRLPAA